MASERFIEPTAVLSVTSLDQSLVELLIAVSIDNEIIGEPEVQCGSDTLEMQFRTRKPFRGKVYVKGQYHKTDCRQDYSGATSTRPTAGIVVSHGKCNMDRQRMITPDHGMQFSAVLVVSFHGTFITSVDRAFAVKCMYRELSKTVQSGLEVSMLTTERLSHNFPMPTCTYTIRKDRIDGDVLRYAQVGQQVVHRWECDSDIYGILVHSCYVEDGQGEQVQVVDEHGCAVDDYVLGDPTYVEKLNMAYREAMVIKFADRLTVRFLCQIRLCMKADQGCENITPPFCGRKRPLPILEDGVVSDKEAGNATNTKVEKKQPGALERPVKRVKRSGTSPLEAAKKPRMVLEFKPIDADFISNTLYVLDSTEDPDKGTTKEATAVRNFLRAHSGGIVAVAPPLSPSAPYPHQAPSVCLSVSVFSVLFGAITCVFLVVAFVVAVLCLRRTRLCRCFETPLGIGRMIGPDKSNKIDRWGLDHHEYANTSTTS